MQSIPRTTRVEQDGYGFHFEVAPVDATPAEAAAGNQLWADLALKWYFEGRQLFELGRPNRECWNHMQFEGWLDAEADAILAEKDAKPNLGIEYTDEEIEQMWLDAKALDEAQGEFTDWRG